MQKYQFGFTILSTQQETIQGQVEGPEAYNKKATDVRNANRLEAKSNPSPRITYWIRPVSSIPAPIEGV